VGTQELATVYAGVVEALDSCMANCLANADIVLVFSTGYAKVRLSQCGPSSIRKVSCAAINAEIGRSSSEQVEGPAMLA
jgi:hypothetical protein